MCIYSNSPDYFLLNRNKYINGAIGLPKTVYNKINNIKKEKQYSKTLFGSPPITQKTQYNMTKKFSFLVILLFHCNIARILVPLFPQCLYPVKRNTTLVLCIVFQLQMSCIVFVTTGCWFLSKLQPTKGFATQIHTHNIPTFQTTLKI